MGLGSNLGSRVQNINRAVDLLGAHLDNVRRSSLFETKPVGFRDQPNFVNAVCSANSNLLPLQLLFTLLEIERAMGRVREIRWGPRIIDIDILQYDDLILSSPELVIPHPEMLKRAFVLVPLAEIAPDLIHPVAQCTIKKLLEEFPNPTDCKKLCT